MLIERNIFTGRFEIWDYVGPCKHLVAMFGTEAEAMAYLDSEGL